MFTRCSNCGTLFRVTAAVLAVAQGEVECGHCGSTFNALATLRDDPGEDSPAPQHEAETAGPEQEAVPPDSRPEPDLGPTDRADPANHPAGAAEERAASSTLEFDVPEGEWLHFFDDEHGTPPAEVGPAEETPETAVEFEIRSLTDTAPQADPATGEPINPADEDKILTLDDETSDTDTWEAFLRDVPGEDEAFESPLYVIEQEDRGDRAAPDTRPAAGESAASAEDIEATEVEVASYDLAEEDAEEPEIPGEIPLRDFEDGGSFDEAATGEPPSVLAWGRTAPSAVPARRHSGWWLAGSALLAVALTIQFIHYDRDVLATDERFGGAIRDFYSRLGVPLYPAWKLDSYEIRGAEAIAGRTAAGALDVIADIAVVGNQPAGLPLVRVVLRDRWSNVVASRVVKPAEYSAEPQSRTRILAPGILLPLQISLADPGPAAQGYELDVCLPNRHQGLQCQMSRDPFRR